MIIPIDKFILLSQTSTDVVNAVKDKDVEQLTGIAKYFWGIVKSFNWISIYHWMVDNAWVDLAGVRVPLFAIIIAIYLVLIAIARKIRFIAVILIALALISFFNSFIMLA